DYYCQLYASSAYIF
nr:immunoglobulin light chain junction region [Macaca mulatta]MOX17014.1 immunoglobulin light chain junction region [Macaca mulatta]MOX17159.1 immunoglobulin light chain junction region [Macaca mulatta]MOX17263.1 immunoglobulin light chain junction region [Macaca mulatta]MOX17970.1 immunoglobulin light chain junction region [Macaca mulatta]